MYNIKLLPLFCFVLLVVSSLRSQDTQALFSIPGLSVSWQLTDDIGGKSKWTYYFNQVTSLCGEELLEYEYEYYSVLKDTLYLKVDGSKVYRYDIEDCEYGSLLYDFDLEVGDEFSPYTKVYTVTHKSTEVYGDGLERRRIELDSSEVWIEGIGGLDEGLLFIFMSADKYICSKIDQEVVHVSEDSNCAEKCPFYGCKRMTADFQYEQVGRKVQLQNTSEHFSSVSWILPDGSSSSESNPVITLEGDGCHKVTLAIDNSCNDGPFLKTRYISYCTDSIWVKKNAVDSITQMAFMDNNIGVGITDDKIFRTVDGGNSWSEIFFQNSNSGLFSVSMNSFGVGMITFGQNSSATGTVVMMSYDSGETWRQVAASTNILLDCIVTDDGTCFAERHPNYFYLSTNNGQSFFSRNFPNDYSLKFFDYHNGQLYAVGRRLSDGITVFASTIDNGQNWQYIEIPGYRVFDMEKLEMASDSVGFIGVKDILLKTMDRWTSFSVIPLSDNRNITDIEFVNESIGWVTAQEGLIYHTTDGGNSWQKEYCLNENYIYDLVVSDSTVAYVSIVGQGVFAFNPDPNFECQNRDDDSDGVIAISDCDDNDPNNFPGNSEICDNADNNCDQQIDEGLVVQAYYIDIDMDGYGDNDTVLEDCKQPAGTSLEGGDCDDTNAEVFPGAEEIPNNGIDENCDGMDLIVSTEEIETDKLSVYPNPFTGILFLENESKRISFEVYDLKSSLIYKDTTSNGQFNLSYLSSGIYLLKIITDSDGTVVVKRVIKL